MHLIPSPDSATPDLDISAQVAEFRRAFNVWSKDVPVRVVFFALLQEWCDRIPGFLDNTDDTNPGPDLWRKPGKGWKPDNDGIQPDGQVVVTFSMREYVLGTCLGMLRALANRNSGDSEDYSNGLNNPERVAQANAVLAEMAVAKHLGIEFVVANGAWPRSEHDQNRSASDLPKQDIEVRLVTNRAYDPAVKRKDAQSGRILMAVAPNDPEFYQARILGWGFARDLYKKSDKPGWWPKGKPWNKHRNARAVKQELLEKCTCTARDAALRGHTCKVANAA